MLDQRHKRSKLRKPSSYTRNQVRPHERLIETDLFGCRIFLDPVDTRKADPALGYIDDPSDRQVVLPVIYRLQITQEILNLPPCIEVHTADDLIWDISRHELLFKHAGLGIGAVQDRMIIICTFFLFDTLSDVIHNILCLVITCIKLPEFDLAALAVRRPQGLVLPSDIIADHRIRRIQNIAGRTIVLLKLDYPCILKELFEIQNIPDVRPAEFVDRLIVVTDHAQIPVLGGQDAHQFKLYRIRILIFIHHDITETLLIMIQYIRLRLEQLYGLHQQVVKIQGIIRP